MTLPGAHRSTRAKDTTFLACSVSLKVWQLPSTCLHLSLHGSLHVYLEMPVLQTAHGCRSSGSTAQGSPSLVHACQKPAGRHACRLRSETMGEGSKAAIVTRVHRRPSWAVPRVGGEQNSPRHCHGSFPQYLERRGRRRPGAWWAHSNLRGRRRRQRLRRAGRD